MLIIPKSLPVLTVEKYWRETFLMESRGSCIFMQCCLFKFVFPLFIFLGEDEGSDMKSTNYSFLLLSNTIELIFFVCTNLYLFWLLGILICLPEEMGVTFDLVFKYFIEKLELFSSPYNTCGTWLKCLNRACLYGPEEETSGKREWNNKSSSSTVAAIRNFLFWRCNISCQNEIVLVYVCFNLLPGI